MATGIAVPEVQLLSSEVIRQISTDQSKTRQVHRPLRKQNNYGGDKYYFSICLR